MRKIAQLLAIVATLFFAVHFPWTHAALAATVADGACPQSLRTEAAERVGVLFGAARAEPVFLCLHAPVAGLAVSHGSARFAPLLPSVVVLGPQGMNGDVAAHELAHAELAERTSAWLRTFRVPTWFDEGLAMQPDHREAYGRPALRRYLAEIEVPRLRDIDRPSTFFRTGTAGRANYAFARCVVGAWLAAHGPERLQRLIDGVGWTRPFPAEEFAAHERTCLT